MLYQLYSFFKNQKIRNLIIRIILRQDNGAMYSEKLRKIFEDFHGIEIGYGTYGGCFVAGNVPPQVQFGNYCSIAPQIKILRLTHPLTYFSTHPLLYHPSSGYVSQEEHVDNKLFVGHDVWIGEQAIILPQVNKIGNGAIIGAGSIVTKNVEPYSIVVGNPAKHIRYRFSPEVIAELEKTQWWLLKKEKLINIIPSLNEIISKKSS